MGDGDQPAAEEDGDTREPRTDDSTATDGGQGRRGEEALEEAEEEMGDEGVADRPARTAARAATHQGGLSSIVRRKEEYRTWKFAHAPVDWGAIHGAPPLRAKGRRPGPPQRVDSEPREALPKPLRGWPGRPSDPLCQPRGAQKIASSDPFFDFLPPVDDQTIRNEPGEPKKRDFERHRLKGGNTSLSITYFERPNAFG